MRTLDRSSPVVVGGVGGSGTRLMAEILMKLGFFMGHVVDTTKDNILFAPFFFRKPKNFEDFFETRSEEFHEALENFVQLMFSPFSPRHKQLVTFIKGIYFLGFPWNHRYAQRPLKKRLKVVALGLRHAARTVCDLRLCESDYIGWGWKEPISHIFLKDISQHFPSMKYIHVMRNGLDMAFSNNRSQLLGWADYFGIIVPHGSELEPKASLQYWIQANKRAVEVCKHFLKDRFLILNFEKLCRSPYNELARLIRFLGREPASVDMNKLCSFIHIPSSIDRYKSRDLSIFSNEEMQTVESLQREVGAF